MASQAKEITMTGTYQSEDFDVEIAEAAGPAALVTCYSAILTPRAQALQPNCHPCSLGSGQFLNQTTNSSLNLLFIRLTIIFYLEKK